MEINDLIYKEIEMLDLKECYRNKDLAPICDEVCARVLYEKPFDDLDDIEREELGRDLCVAIKRIPIESLLFNALRFWYCAQNDYTVLADLVRGGYIDNGYLYFGTGYGYDTISSDLLGCKANGHAKEIFIKFCNEPESTMRLGGAFYMNVLGCRDDIGRMLESTYTTNELSSKYDCFND